MAPDAKRRPVNGAGESETTRVTSSNPQSTIEVKTPRPEVDAIGCVMACSSIESPWRCPLIGGEP
jgi:hypothetical protein